MGHFKATKVKIACGVSSVRDGSNRAIGRLFSFDYLDRDEDLFGAMSRPSQQKLDFLYKNRVANEAVRRSNSSSCGKIVQSLLFLVLIITEFRTHSLIDPTTSPFSSSKKLNPNSFVAK